MYRRREGNLEVLFVHPGGPFFAKKDEGVWGIPKGIVEEGEDIFDAAKREFEEETGLKPAGDFIDLGHNGGEAITKGKKTIYMWAFEGDCDPSMLTCNTFEMEWPPHSRKMQAFPENDKADFFSLEEARQKIFPAQLDFLNQLKEMLNNT